MMNPMSEELMFANMRARDEQIRRAFPRTGRKHEARRWWRASHAKATAASAR